MKIKQKFLFVKLISSCIDSCNFFSALVFCNVSHLIFKLLVQNHSYGAFQNTNGHVRYLSTYSWVSSERHLTLQTKHIFTVRVFCLLIVYGIKRIYELDAESNNCKYAISFESEALQTLDIIICFIDLYAWAAIPIL